MNINNASKNKTRSWLVAAISVVMLSAFTTASFGQKEESEVPRATSRDGLTAAGFMTKPDISDELDGNNDEYFYKFKAGPGKLTVTVEVIANETNAGATLDLFGGNNNAILSNILVQAANGGSEQAFHSVNLAKAQIIVIRIKGMKYGSSARYPGVYKIRLEGTAVNFNTGAPAEGPGVGDKAAPPLIPEIGQATDQAPTPADNAGPAPKSATAPASESGKDKKPGTVDRAIDKAQKKTGKVLEVLEKVKVIKP